MAFKRYGTFIGGIDLPDDKQDTLDLPIKAVPGDWLTSLSIPLAIRDGTPSVPLVKAGQKVAAGQMLASAGDLSGVNVYSPLDGVVASLPSAEVLHSTPSSARIVLSDVSATGPVPAADEIFDWKAASPDQIQARIETFGVSTFRRAEPLAGWLANARRKKCHTLIANVLENQPYVTTDHRLLVEYGQQVIAGLAMLAKVIGLKKIILVVDRRFAGEYSAIASAASRLGIDCVALTGKYPIGATNILVKVLCRREVPLGGWPMDIGVAVTHGATCFAAWRAVVCGQPHIARVVTVAGKGAENPGNYWTPFGASCIALAGGRGDHTQTMGQDDEEVDGMPVVVGGPMVGSRCTARDVVNSHTNVVLVMDVPVPAAPTPCIRCGWCTDHCPARLNVSALNDEFELGKVGRARAAGVLACVECGVCTYVCPARLPLSQRVWRLKQAVHADIQRIAIAARRPGKTEAAK